jgi:hypothetical protein
LPERREERRWLVGKRTVIVVGASRRRAPHQKKPTVAINGAVRTIEPGREVELEEHVIEALENARYVVKDPDEYYAELDALEAKIDRIIEANTRRESDA